MDIAQLPHLPEKTSESSETSDSESDSKDNSGNIHGVPLHPQKCKNDSHVVGFPVAFALQGLFHYNKTKKNKQKFPVKLN